jgi:hypothetical protein
MLFAAIALGVAAALRPSEMLGSRAHPLRALRAEQISFFDAARRPLLLHRDSDSGAAPDHFHVSLEVSKTDQGRRGSEKPVATPVAVQALWRWWRLSGARGSIALFQSGNKQLTTNALVGHLRRCLALIGHGDGYFTGRSLRKGGASTLSAQGVAAADIAAVGWANGSNVWQAHYANHPEVRRERQLAISRSMEAAFVRGP